VKVSYKVLKKYIPDIKSPEEVATDLIMHTAEVEEIHETGKHLERVFIGKIVEVAKHPEADKLNICQVEVLGETRQIICGAPNVKVGIKVSVALEWAELKPDFIIAKTKIRGETSNWMICSEDELWLIEERQEWILILPDDAELDTCMRDYLWINDIILEIDNKAINHRPDLFSHIGIAREISAITGKKLDYDMAKRDFSSLPDLGIKNDIPHIVKRYMGLKVSGVENIASPEYVKDLLVSHDIESKGLLVDITNYSLYLYGQPTHCFDEAKLTGSIHIRFANNGEKFTALNDKTYSLHSDDIVIADEAGVIALGGIIGGKDSAVSDTTKTIIIESAWFDQAVVRKTGKRLGIRTDALNVFEKDLVSSIRDTGPSLIIQELEKNLSSIKLEAFTDVYENPEGHTSIDFDLKYINALIWRNYPEQEALEILAILSITEKDWKLTIPLWRKDLNTKADIAEEIARIDGYDKVKMTVPRINLGAIAQTITYQIKKESRNFLVSRGFYDMYTYSFVSEELMNKCNSSIKNLIGLKNALSEEITHMRGSLIPNLLLSLENNTREYKNLKLFEIGKVFHLKDTKIEENYEIAGVIAQKSENQYYEVQTTVSDLCKTLKIDNLYFETIDEAPSYSHPGRTGKIIVRGQEVGYVGEVHPMVAESFELRERIGYFTLDVSKIEKAVHTVTKAREVSQFQENNFDINFVVDKSIKAKHIQVAIEKTNPQIITKVELFDIYEDEEKLSGQRSFSYTVYMQSLEWTLDDTVKNTLIQDIVKRVEKKWGKLR